MHKLSAHEVFNSLFFKTRIRSAVFAAVSTTFLIALNVLFLTVYKIGAPPALPADAQALPRAGRIICVDAGHGGYDGGARARDSGLWEKHLNLAVAEQTRQALEGLGAQVIMTRTEDIDYAAAANDGATRKRRDMNHRLALAREGGAQLLVSIHMNEYRDRSVSGPQVFYTKGHDASRLLAGCLQEALIQALKPPKERAAQAGDYYILRLAIPSVLVECGFISNPQEEKQLLDKTYQQQLGEAIAQGICTYFAFKTP